MLTCHSIDPANMWYSLDARQVSEATLIVVRQFFCNPSNDGDSVLYQKKI